MTTPANNYPDIGPEDWDRIARLLSGEADATEAEATRKWLAADPARLETVTALQSAIGSIHPSPPVDVEAALGRVKSRFGSSPVIPLPVRRTGIARESTAPYLRAAAVALILIGSGLLWQTLRERDANGTARTFATSIGERKEFSLGDGTTVVLGPVSTLRFVSEDGERDATLTGDAYFRVAHDPGHPFVVHVGGASVRDVGTAFSIRTDEEGALRVAVDSGAVMIGDSAAVQGEGALLKAGDRAAIDNRGTAKIERGTATDDDRAWTQGRLVFRDAPLIEVATELYRWYGVRLRVADSSLATLHLTASFSGEPIDRVLNVIALSLGARVERQGNLAILRRSGSIPATR